MNVEADWWEQNEVWENIHGWKWTLVKSVVLKNHLPESQ